MSLPLISSAICPRQAQDEAKRVTTAKRACASCSQHGMVTARLIPERTDLVMPL